MMWIERGAARAAMALLGALTLALVGAWAAGATTAAGGERAPACSYVLGFRMLHDLIPRVVGDCVSNETHNPDNGDGLQQTENGLLVWRKADNWTAFTDGTTTWINGPEGLQSRPNDQRFPWEAAAATPTPQPPVAPPTPQPPVAATGTLAGQVAIGPLSPVQRVGEPAPTPSPSACTARGLNARSAAGGPIIHIPLAPDCTFSQVLPTGVYTVSLAGTGADRSPQLPATVEVVANQTTRLDVSVDTGLR